VTLLSRLRATKPTEERTNILRVPGGYAILGNEIGTPSGVAVSGESAMRHDAVWSCVTAIAQDVAMLPVDVVRYVNGTRQDVTPVPQIVAAPSATVAALDWIYQVIESCLLDGNVYGRVTATTSDGRYPLRIELIPFPDVRPADNEVAVYVNGEREDLWPLGPIWHVPAYTLPGSWHGLSPIAYHRHKIGAGLAAGKFGEEFFGGGGHPTAILAPETDPGEGGAKRLKQSFMAATRGREPAVLPQSITYTRVQVSPEDSQFIDAMRYSVEQVCRVFREDPADHGSSSGGSSMTYANRSDADLARFKRRQFWVVKLQEALTALLPQPQKVRLNTSSALMMTPRERHELHALRLNSHTITVNEVRTIEDERPFDGDEYDAPGVPADASPTFDPADDPGATP
jgi:HK97 family phage portal protein